MRRSVLVAFLSLFLSSAVSTPSHAGSRTTRLGVVNLDENPGSHRFDKLKQGFAAAIKAGAGGVIDGVEVVPRARLARFLRPGCGLAMPSEEWQKLEEEARLGRARAPARTAAPCAPTAAAGRVRS